MKFTIESSVLKDAARFVARMTPSRPTQPILAGVLMHADATAGVKFTVFDYERAAQTVADATVDDGGVALMHAKLLQSIADKLPSKPVHVEVDGAALRLKCGASKFTIPLMPAEEYPSVSFDGETVAVMGSSVFEDAVARVAGMASRDDVTPILSSVQVEASGEDVVFRATDRYRVAEAHAVARVAREVSLLIPAHMLAECAKAFTGDVTISVIDGDNPKAVIAGSEGVMLSSTMAGNYPPVGRLMDADRSGETAVDSGALIDAVGRCSLVVEREDALRFAFDHLAVTVSGASESDASETVDCDGDVAELGLKPQFVVEGLKACRSERVRIEFTAGGGKPGPILIHGSHGYRYLLQPNFLVK